MTQIAVTEIDGSQLTNSRYFHQHVVENCSPVVIRQLVAHWPVVSAAAQSKDELAAYLNKFDVGGDVEMFVGHSDIKGKYYYNSDLSAFNFERRLTKLRDAIDAIIATSAVGHKTLYLGAISADDYLPGFSLENRLDVMAMNISPRVWLGHASNVSTHYDTLDNLACVVTGKRRFSLFPPRQIGNLYIGPIDHTMAGQPVSLAASVAQDDTMYPRFASAKATMMVAELEPGDALYLPKLWWHKVESTAAVNGLVNYWWDAFSAGPDSPYTSLLLAMIAIAERPEAERAAWKSFFDHYVFRPDGHPLAHLPAEKHGLLGPLQMTYGSIRARVMHLLRNVR